MTAELAPTAASLERVGRATSPEAARWAFGQWELRRRASAKFEKAAEMLFDRDGLQMASHERVAAYHASLFPEGDPVVDMTAGIGSDTLALAARRPVIAYELLPERAEYLRHNLDVHGLVAEVRVGDAVAAPVGAACAFCDPSRRTEGRRLRRLDDFSPDPHLVAKRMGSIERGVMKLSPMLADADLRGLGGRIEFVSFQGECKEALVVFGDVETGPRAVHIESGEILEAANMPAAEGPGLVEPQKYLLEADPAAIRAHCLSELCSRFNLAALGDSNGYLTGASPAESPWLSPFEVLASHPADTRRTRAELRRLGGGTPIVKSRAGANVEDLRKAWKGEGEELIVLIYPVGRSIRHVIARKSEGR